jgi:hypothetical protein
MASTSRIEHPSPRAAKVSLTRQAVGLMFAPAAWALRLCVNFAIASNGCRPETPAQVGLRHPVDTGTVMLAIDIAALLGALVASYIAYHDWRMTGHEKPGTPADALEIGEGRARFLALLGVIVSLGFGLAILFDLTALFIVPYCSR